ncbi:hypothetical protein E2320_006896 [Naja naja]|nr:hypothetical protein E2320_006896 [Naja naja]
MQKEQVPLFYSVTLRGKVFFWKFCYLRGKNSVGGIEGMSLGHCGPGAQGDLSVQCPSILP